MGIWKGKRRPASTRAKSTPKGSSTRPQDMPAGGLGLLNQLFEATSAFCTVGVSTGVTAVTSNVTRVLLILLMYAGRVGLITVAMSLVEGTTKEVVLHYPQEEILIG